MLPSKLLSQFAVILINGVYKEVVKLIFGREDDWIFILFSNCKFYILLNIS